MGTRRKQVVLSEGKNSLRRCGAPLVLLVVVIWLIVGVFGCTKKKPADTKAPTVPIGVSITAVSSSEVRVSWKPSIDDSGKIKEYKVYRNGQPFGKTDQLAASDKTLTPKVKFCYRVSALDEAGNESVQSPDVCAMLQ